MARSISTKPATVKSRFKTHINLHLIYACDHDTHGCGYILFDHNLEAIGKYVGDANYHHSEFRICFTLQIL